MGTNVSQMRMEDFTDKSGKFHIGMKREEAEEMKNSLFVDYQKEFDRVDTNENKVIDPEELLAEIKNDKVSTFKWGKINMFAFLITGFITRNVNAQPAKNFCRACVLYDGIISLIEFIQSRKLGKRADALEELIKNQPKEAAAA